MRRISFRHRYWHPYRLWRQLRFTSFLLLFIQKKLTLHNIYPLDLIPLDIFALLLLSGFSCTCYSISNLYLVVCQIRHPRTQNRLKIIITRLHVILMRCAGPSASGSTPFEPSACHRFPRAQRLATTAGATYVFNTMA